MNKTAETGYWTTATPDGAVTYCAQHALVAVNTAMVFSGLDPADSMAEAATVLEAHLAMAGDTDDLLAFSEYGTCELCKSQPKGSTT